MEKGLKDQYDFCTPSLINSGIMTREPDDDGLKELSPTKPEGRKRYLRKRVQKQKVVQGAPWEWANSPEDAAATERNSFTCQICLKNFVSKSNLQIHSNIHSGERFECGQCHKSFTQRCNLKRHETVHLGQKLFHCTECSKSFTQKANLQRHFAMHAGNRKFSCDTCGKKFGQKSNLKKHMERHSQEVIPLVECVLHEDSS